MTELPRIAAGGTAAWCPMSPPVALLVSALTVSSEASETRRMFDTYR